MGEGTWVSATIFSRISIHVYVLYCASTQILAFCRDCSRKTFSLKHTIIRTYIDKYYEYLFYIFRGNHPTVPQLKILRDASKTFSNTFIGPKKGFVIAILHSIKAGLLFFSRASMWAYNKVYLLIVRFQWEHFELFYYYFFFKF